MRKLTMLKYVLFSFFVAGQAMSAAGSGGGILAPNVNVSGITSGVQITVTGTGVNNIQTKLDTQNAWMAATVNTISTVYIQSLTTSITGAAWIDCREAEKVIFTVAYAARNDSAAVAGVSVTNYIDVSGEISTNLPSLSVQPWWNMWVGKTDSTPTTPTIISNVPQMYEVSPVPASLRWRTVGVFNATMSVYYKIVRKR